MDYWPNWIYITWACVLRITLFPIVFPVRVYENIVSHPWPNLDVYQDKSIRTGSPKGGCC